MKQNIQQYVGYWINRTRACMHTAFEKRLEQYDLTMAQWCVIVAVYSNEASTISTLADQVRVDKGSISRVVEKLVQKGILSHVEGKDRRSGKIELTDSGQVMAPKLIEEGKDNEAFFLEDFSSAEMAELQRLMRKILIKDPSTLLEGWILKETL
jgi:DNA-binding MarR family transcriptional regulator